MATDEATSSLASPAAAELDADVVRCPSCGYDLRGTTSDRCSECGLVVDREELRESAIPWAHRHRIGRVRAFVRTVWQITLDYKRLRSELDKPQSLPDARRFRRVITIPLVLTVCTAAWLWIADEGLSDFEIKIPAVDEYANLRSEDGSRLPAPGWMYDVAVPWSYGMRLFPVFMLAIAALITYWTGVTARAMRRRRDPQERRQRQTAMGQYAVAPLAFLPPAIAIVLIGGVVDSASSLDSFSLLAVFLMPLFLLAVTLFVFGVFCYFWRSGEWVTRAGDASVAGFFTGLLAVLARWCVGVVMFMGVWPWCAGLWWIMLDSP